MSKRTEELFKLHKQIELLTKKEDELKDEILKEEILGKNKNNLQDRFVVVGYNKGTEPKVTIDCDSLSKMDAKTYMELIAKYPRVSKGRSPYYTWNYAKDK